MERGEEWQTYSWIHTSRATRRLRSRLVVSARTRAAGPHDEAAAR